MRLYLSCELTHSTAVVITVLNAYSGFALVAEGLMLDNSLLTAVGSLIGVSGSILSYIMVSSKTQTPEWKKRGRGSQLTFSKCVAMNRSLTNVLFGGVGGQSDKPPKEIEGEVTPTSVNEVADSLAGSQNVIIVSL